MERVSAHTVTSTTFCLHNSAMKSRVHFFPSAGITTGPYSISCTFTLFGKGVEKKSVAVDGGRLGQPDGIRLEDAFPALRGDASGVFGLTLEVSCQQQRINMLPTQGAIELVSPQSTVLYGLPQFTPSHSVLAHSVLAHSVLAHSVVDARVASEDSDRTERGSIEKIGANEQGIEVPRGAAVMLDSFATTSLVVINPNRRVLKPSLYRLVQGERVAMHFGTVAAESAVEIPLEDALLRESSPFECSWGLFRTEMLYVGEPTYSDISIHGTVTPAGTIPQSFSQISSSIASPSEEMAPTYCLLYRDPTTKRPLSASAL